MSRAERSDPAAVLADVEVVVPTVGRSSLQLLLRAFAAGHGPLPRRIVLVDDRPVDVEEPLLPQGPPTALAGRVAVVRSGGRGPAAARNAGWRACTAPWVAFLDDDVLPPLDWTWALAGDLADVADDVAGSQGRIEVPLPSDRRPTDWERNVAGLEDAQWATADLAYRRDVLARVGGFDERFPRAYREDADLGLRIVRAGYRIVRGTRRIVHPVRPADAAVSVRLQAGNAEDPFMWALHGPGWREAAGVPPGRRPWHLATVASALLTVAAGIRRRRRLATVAAAIWAGLTGDFAWRRIAPGPRDRTEIVRMAWTSAVLPFAATWHWLRGWLSLPARRRRPGPTPLGDADLARRRSPAEPSGSTRRPAAILFDRDGTLVHDVPYNGDPSLVAPVDGAAEVLRRVRALGIATGVVTNQSGIARGLLSPEQVAAVNARVDEVLGPFGTWQHCPHGPDDGCRCRKPAPGMVLRAAEELGVAVEDCVVIGDTGADVDAALAAGARAILVPNPVTLREEVAAAPEVATTLVDAVERALAPPPTGDRAATRARGAA